jgi:hypothetical protein
VTHKLRVVLLERGRSKNVVGVDVGHDDVLDRQLSRLPNGCTKALSIDQASTRIDDRYRVTANNESDVGYCVFVLRRDVFVHAPPDVNSRRDFLGDKRVRAARACCYEDPDAAEARSCDYRLSTC